MLEIFYINSIVLGKSYLKEDDLANSKKYLMMSTTVNAKPLYLGFSKYSWPDFILAKKIT